MKDYKIQYNKHILDDYIVDGNAIIKVLVEDESSIYNKLDPKKSLLDKSILDYISEESYKIPFKYNITIEFISSNFSDEEKEKITKIMKNYYASKISSFDAVIRTNLIKFFCLILFGTFMIICSFIGDVFFGPIYEEVINVVGWVLLWEGVDIVLFSNNEYKVEKKNYKQLYDAKVVFSDKLELK